MLLCYILLKQYLSLSPAGGASLFSISLKSNQKGLVGYSTTSLCNPHVLHTKYFAVAHITATPAQY